MSKLKIHIAFRLRDEASGGGNRFLFSLREKLVELGVYAWDIGDADVALINSFHRGQEDILRAVIKEKIRTPSLIVAHRVDGPFELVRGRPDSSDRSVLALNNLLADATIFQSNWSKEECRRLGLAPSHPTAVIHNAANENLFFNHGRSGTSGSKVRLVASSWSQNPNKGYETYRWLDENLDWTRYEMSFFGNLPGNLRNIKVIPPLGRLQLAAELRTYDFYISAARNEPCSNAIIEAIQSGLPVIGFRGGGTPELLGSGGGLFSHPHEIPTLLDQLSKDYPRARSTLDSLESVAKQYQALFEEVRSTRVLKRVPRIRRLGFSIVHLSLVSRLLSQPLTAIWTKFEEAREGSPRNHLGTNRSKYTPGERSERSLRTTSSSSPAKDNES